MKKFRPSPSDDEPRRPKRKKNRSSTWAKRLILFGTLSVVLVAGVFVTIHFWPPSDSSPPASFKDKKEKEPFTLVSPSDIPKKPDPPEKTFKYSGTFFYKDAFDVNASYDGVNRIIEETTSARNLRFFGDMAVLYDAMLNDGLIYGEGKFYAYPPPLEVGKPTTIQKTGYLGINPFDLKKLCDWLAARNDPHRHAAALICFESGAHRLPANAVGLDYRLKFHGGGMDILANFEKAGETGSYFAVASTEGNAGILNTYLRSSTGPQTLVSTHRGP